MRAPASFAAIVLAACSYPSGRVPEVDAGIDAPPTNPSVRWVSVTSAATSVRPGRYSIEVTAVLHNDLDVEITDVAASLTLGGRDKELRVRDADRREGVMAEQPALVPARGDVMYRFVVDALPWLSPADVELNGDAVFTNGGMKMSAVPLATPMRLQYTGINAPIVVNTASDESNSDAQTSLREAIETANVAPGPDRIVFDAAALPPGSVITLSSAHGELPTISSDLVIDGTGTEVTLALTSAWETPEGRYGLRITGGNIAVSGLTFRDFAYNYRNESISSNNCGTSMAQLEGGAIRIDGGTVVLDNNRFEDPDVAERNCYAASVRIHGGAGHRIVGNTWTDQVMDSVYVGAAVAEITDNVMIAPNTPDRDDEGVYVAALGGKDLWIVGNLIVDNEYSAVRSGGNDAGKLYIVNNTFVRNGRTALSAVRREGGARATVLRNNLYIANMPAAVQVDNNGTGFNIAYETITGSALCNGGCGSAMLDAPTVDMPANAGVENSSGTTRADFTPIASSPLVGTATSWLDRNGRAPRHFNGAGQERGAVELP